MKNQRKEGKKRKLWGNRIKEMELKKTEGNKFSLFDLLNLLNLLNR